MHGLRFKQLNAIAGQEARNKIMMMQEVGSLSEGRPGMTKEGEFATNGWNEDSSVRLGYSRWADINISR